LHPARRPADAHEQTVRFADADLIRGPLPVAEDAAGTDDQALHPRGDGIHLRRADEISPSAFG
jgi:hypothetical protein